MTEAVETLTEIPERSRRKILPWKVSEGFVAALPIIILLIIGFAGPMVLVLVYSFMPRGSFSVSETPSLENYVDIVEQNFYISFSWSLFLAFISVVILLIGLLSAGDRAEADQGTPVPPAHAADRGAALRRREHPAAGLGALLRQERLPRRRAQGGDGSRDRGAWSTTCRPSSSAFATSTCPSCCSRSCWGSATFPGGAGGGL